MNTTTVSFARDGKTIVSGGYDGSLRIWDVATGKELKKLEGSSQEIEYAAITPDGKRVMSGGQPGAPTLRVWDVASGNLVFETEALGGGILCVAATPDNRGCITASRDGLVRLWQWKR